MRWVRIGDVVTVTGGGTPRMSESSFFGGDIPWVTPKDMKQHTIDTSSIRLSLAGVANSPAKIVDAGSTLVVVRSGVLKHTLPVAIAARPVALNQDMKALSPERDLVAPEYLVRLVKAQESRVLRSVRATTADNFPIDSLLRIEIPLPPLAEQRRIAAILDEADALRQSAQRRIALLPAVLARAYDKSFGDPRSNPREWPIRQIGDVALKVSDGPFGSNLKSAHYTGSGVRVVRLQNIGVDEFLGADAAYISEAHFLRLKRHELLAGDVVVGALGDPILRACVVPGTLGRAINKADCVQIRPDESLAKGPYLSATLNHPSMVKSAQSLAHGQTRSRISMSQIRALGIPIPPHRLQREFEDVRSRYALELAAMCSARDELDEIFASLQHRAFRGEL